MRTGLGSSPPTWPADLASPPAHPRPRCSLYMLEGQCDVWNGVISAAVYIALVGGKVVTVELNSNQDPRLTDIKELESKFKQFHQLAEAKGAPPKADGWLDGRSFGWPAPSPPVALLTLAVSRALPHYPC